MLFNSFHFIVFFIVVYSFYLLLNYKWQNRMLLAASYYFYACWDWRFLSLLLAVTLFNFHCAKWIYNAKNGKRKKLLLVLSVAFNLSVFCFFKYTNFFISNLIELLKATGLHINLISLNIILPLGISFFTFQVLGYIIDVYRGNMDPEEDLLTFALFKAYFPQLVAGPIERANNLLVQLRSPRSVNFDNIVDGLWLILWGFFLKIFMADNLANIVNETFKIGASTDGFSALIGVYSFAFQILGDFAGYSSIAIGVSKLMGINLRTNFLYPYFVTNPRDFWRNWHISLSTWLRDYLYIPLGGNRSSTLLTYRNLFITMLLGGLWHGAEWTFVVWGVYHGIILIIYRIIQPYIPKQSFQRKLGILWKGTKILFMFHVVCLGWLFFRSESLAMGISMLRNIVFNSSELTIMAKTRLWGLFSYTWLFLIIQYIQYTQKSELIRAKIAPTIKISLLLLIIYSIIIWGEHYAKVFIYFQF